MTEPWPPLPYAEWEPTKQTLHRYAQIVGKIRMALVPARNHWWHVPLLPDTRGLTTGPMPHGGRYVEIAFDLLDHRLVVSTGEGGSRVVELGRRPACADFYRDVFAALDDLEVHVHIHPKPFDLGDSPPFADDTAHDSYDAEAVSRYWGVLAGTDRVLAAFASRFNGKASPTHLFWHSFDLAHSRYSGRPAPATDGAVGSDVDTVTAEAYSHEVIAFGFWPGDDRRTPYPAFYSYTAPEPAGLAAEVLDAGGTWQDTGSGHLALLAYDDMRTTPDPARTLLAFYESAYQAGARTAGWDVDAFATRVVAGR